MITPRRRVLVIDDHVDAAEMLGVFLDATGFDVRVVHDSRAAVAEAEAFRPEVMLLDLSMPHVSGLDVCRQVRSESWGAAVQIIALTGWTGERHRQETTAAGFDMFVIKPVEPDALLAILAALP